MREGTPAAHGTLRVWPQVGRSVGAQAISLRVLEFMTGRSPGLCNQTCDEIIYVLKGAATVFIDGRPYPIQPETGIYLRLGATLTIDNPSPEPLILISAQCPEPAAQAELVPALIAQAAEASPLTRPPIVRLAERKMV